MILRRDSLASQSCGILWDNSIASTLYIFLHQSGERMVPWSWQCQDPPYLKLPRSSSSDWSNVMYLHGCLKKVYQEKPFPSKIGYYYYKSRSQLHQGTKVFLCAGFCVPTLWSTSPYSLEHKPLLSGAHSGTFWTEMTTFSVDSKITPLKRAISNWGFKRSTHERKSRLVKSLRLLSHFHQQITLTGR